MFLLRTILFLLVFVLEDLIPIPLLDIDDLRVVPNFVVWKLFDFFIREDRSGLEANVFSLYFPFVVVWVDLDLGVCFGIEEGGGDFGTKEEDAAGCLGELGWLVVIHKLSNDGDCLVGWLSIVAAASLLFLGGQSPINFLFTLYSFVFLDAVFVVSIAFVQLL